MPRAAIIAASLLNGRGALIHTKSMEEACEISNRIAPEHLEVSSNGEPQPLGAAAASRQAIFLGAFTSESLGDYCAGPNHVLPTSGYRALLEPAGRGRLPEALEPHRGRARPGPQGARGPSPSRWPRARACRARRGRAACGCVRFEGRGRGPFDGVSAHKPLGRSAPDG